MEHYQAQIVGMDSVPVGHIRGRWSFLDAYANKLKAGQALRLVIPKGTSAGGVCAKWRRISGGKAKFAQKAQPDGSIKVWLWQNNGAMK